MRSRVIETVVSGVFAGLYYVLCAHFLLFWAADGLTTALSLTVGPILAAVWLVAEFVFFLVPFAVIRVWATRSNRSGLTPALAALIVFWLPALSAATSAMAFRLPFPEYGGIGGAVTTGLALSADVVASAAGLVLVLLTRDKGQSRLRPVAAQHGGAHG